MKKQPEITERTKQCFIDAFLELGRNKKISTITVKDVAQKAGYNRGTFYKYFRDILDIRETIEKSILDYLDQFAYLHSEPVSSDLLVKNLTIFLNNKGNELSILLTDESSSGFIKQIKEFIREPFFATWNLDQNDIRSEYIYEYKISAIIATISYWFSGGKTISSDELTKLLNELTNY